MPSLPTDNMVYMTVKKLLISNQVICHLICIAIGYSYAQMTLRVSRANM